MKIRTKVVFAFLLMAAFLLFGGSASLYASAKLSQHSSQVLNKYLPLLDSLVDLKGSLLALEREEIRHPEPRPVADRSEAAAFNDSLTRFSERARLIPGLAIGSSEILLVGEEINAALAAAESGKREVILLPAVSRLDSMIDYAIKATTNEFDRSRLQADARLARIVGFHRVAAMLSVLVCYAISVWFSSQILRRLEQLRHATASIGEGNLQVRIEHGAHDEIDMLAQKLEEMADGLRQNTVTRTYFASLISSMPSLLIVADQRGEILSANSSASDALGVCDSDLAGKSILSILPELRQYIDVLNDGRLKPQPRLENVVIRHGDQSAEVKTLLLSAKLQASSESSQVEILISGQDITQWQQLREERNRYYHQLKRSEHLASLGAMSAMLAHRLNQPLTVLRLYLQQIARAVGGTPVPGEVSHKLEDCLNEVNSVSDTVKEVLQYARRPAAETRRPVRPAEVILKVAATLEDRAADAGLKISVEADCADEVLAAAGEIDEISYILIENAIHAARAAGAAARLVISVNACGSDIVCEFADTCGGIPEDHIDRVFEMFFTTKSPGDGTGLGLCIVKQTVANLGGRLVLDSKQGEGATFRITLPASSGGDEKANRPAVDTEVSLPEQI